MTVKGQNALRDVDRASFGARHENLKEDRRILSTEPTFRRYKVDEDTRWGCVAIGRQTQWCDKKNAFLSFRGI